MPKVESLPLPGIPMKRGRPPTGKALTDAERQQRYRARQQTKLTEKIRSSAGSFEGDTDEELLKWLVTAGPKLQEKAWIELGRRKGWKLP